MLVEDTKTKVAFKKLHSLIESGDLKNGERLSISKAMELTGLKTAPVRDSLKQLVKRGHVTSLGSRRSYVVGFHSNNLEDIIQRSEIRENIESSAAGLAAIYMNGMQIHRLQSLVEKTHMMIKTNDSGRMQASRDLHDYLLANCGNDTLLKIWRTFQLAPVTPFNAEFEKKFHKYLSPEQQGLKGSAVFFEVVKAIKEHDREKAETISRNYLRKITESLRKVLMDKEY